MTKSSNRGLPAPSGASEKLQTAILATPTPDVATWKENCPQNGAAWAAVIDELDSSEKAFIEEHLSDLPVSVEPGQVGGVTVYQVSPAEADPRHEKQLFVHVHGGAHVGGAGQVGLSEALLIADHAKIRLLSIDYRMPPEHPFPSGLDDLVNVYQHLLGTRPAKSLALGGSSSGGGLAMALIHKLKYLGMEVPGALFAGTPWTDLWQLRGFPADAISHRYAGSVLELHGTRTLAATPLWRRRRSSRV